MYSEAGMSELPSMLYQNELAPNFKDATRNRRHSGIKLPIENASDIWPRSANSALQKCVASVGAIYVAEVDAVATHEKARFEKSVLDGAWRFVAMSVER